jgi:hypothetical protein
MSDPTITPAGSARMPAAEANGQLITAVAIVGGLVAITLGLIVAGCLTGQWAILGGLIGTGVGALATALNAPTGIGNVIRAAVGKSQP